MTDVLDRCVTCCVTVPVVYRFQVVDVQGQQCARYTVAAPSFNLTRQGFAKTTPIRQACKRIQISISLQALDPDAQSDELSNAIFQQIELSRQLKIVEGAEFKCTTASFECGRLASGQHKRKVVMILAQGPSQFRIT